MPNFKPSDTDFIVAKVEGTNYRLLKPQPLASFNSSLLGLGDLSKQSISTDAIAAVFDLEGFTHFCKQIEPHLSVPLFLSEFLEWLMQELKHEMIEKTVDAGAALWSPLPFFAKFMGDGLLVLWDASKTGDNGRLNILISADNICKNYRKTFHSKIRKRVVDPPPVLRCGLARGSVYSVGEGNDYVGSCINMAARLQKTPGLTFVFNLRGFNIEKQQNNFFETNFITKCLEVRGIGENELICMYKKEFEALSKKEQRVFRNI